MAHRHCYHLAVVLLSFSAFTRSCSFTISLAHPLSLSRVISQHHQCLCAVVFISSWPCHLNFWKWISQVTTFVVNNYLRLSVSHNFTFFLAMCLCTKINFAFKWIRNFWSWYLFSIIKSSSYMTFHFHAHGHQEHEIIKNVSVGQTEICRTHIYSLIHVWRNQTWRVLTVFLLLLSTGQTPATVWSTEWALGTSGCMVLKMRTGRRGKLTSGWPSSWPGRSLFVWCVFGERTHLNSPSDNLHWNNSMLNSVL